MTHSQDVALQAAMNHLDSPAAAARAKKAREAALLAETTKDDPEPLQDDSGQWHLGPNGEEKGPGGYFGGGKKGSECARDSALSDIKGMFDE